MTVRPAVAGVCGCSRFPMLTSCQQRIVRDMTIAEAGDSYGMLTATSGNSGVKIDHDTGLVEPTKRGFPTVMLGGVLLQAGKWYYEATVVEPGIGQVSLDLLKLA